MDITITMQRDRNSNKKIINFITCDLMKGVQIQVLVDATNLAEIPHLLQNSG
ncbi:MAG: hypothetical protein F6K54_26810 [Okeania sp. SIO3B5]|uniref:hypothetical protein n=1 Tax=Okeania sp. SIO3B5 TaxID=2607811 RepID=UPI0013FEFBFA|nr:hypothetical protein [Okeania sp. SIO3B5]NEO56378.1 hypothetical protein [Okeania sp. SIO3B5]